jgi:hypothetical protein
MKSATAISWLHRVPTVAADFFFWNLLSAHFLDLLGFNLKHFATLVRRERHSPFDPCKIMKE